MWPRLLIQLTSALFLGTTSRHVLYTLPTPICCPSLVSTQPLLPVVSALLPPQYGTHSLLAFTLVVHHILSVVFLKPIVSIRPSVPPSGSHKCLWFGPWSTLCTIKDFIYLLRSHHSARRFQPSSLDMVIAESVPHWPGPICSQPSQMAHGCIGQMSVWWGTDNESHRGIMSTNQIFWRWPLLMITLSRGCKKLQWKHSRNEKWNLLSCLLILLSLCVSSGDVQRGVVRPHETAADVERRTPRQEKGAGGHDEEGACTQTELTQPGHAEWCRLLLQQVWSVWVRALND